jgi:hypothetical protein
VCISSFLGFHKCATRARKRSGFREQQERWRTFTSGMYACCRIVSHVLKHVLGSFMLIFLSGIEDICIWVEVPSFRNKSVYCNFLSKECPPDLLNHEPFVDNARGNYPVCISFFVCCLCCLHLGPHWALINGGIAAAVPRCGSCCAGWS